ncbi:MAG: PQQ-dependent sugar dehydrogenase [Actinomycetota bacterium]
MKPNRFRQLLAPLVMIVGSLAFVPDPAEAAPVFELQRIASGLSNPLGIVNAGDGSGRLFIAEQTGRIRVWDQGLKSTPFLNISSLIRCCGEEGLLGLAFHPNYESNGFFFVYYTNTSGNNTVDRYRASPPSSNVADPSTRREFITIPHPVRSTHNGGQIEFGPDGLFYIGTGDGGGADDPNENAENIESLLGKILRINVNRLPYRIPSSNPFVDKPGRDEIWHWGLRNPWRFSFDRATGDMFIGDVGEDRREEIDFQPEGLGGLNFGWDIMEGSLCNEPSTGCNKSGKTLPIIEYGHDPECSVTGGYVYSGTRTPNLRGRYILGDLCSGRVWAAEKLNGSWARTEMLDTRFLLTSFGEDEAGELYVANWSGGEAYRLLGECGAPSFPGWLAYHPAFAGGVYVGTGDLDGDGCDEIITGAGAGGGPHLKVFRANGSLLAQRMAYATAFTGGVRVAAGDVDGDGRDEVITGPGPGGGPHVRVFDLTGNSLVERLGFMAYDTAFLGGIFVTSENVTGTSRHEIITGADQGGGPHVKIWSGSRTVDQFMAYNIAFRGGARVGTANVDGDGYRELITGAGPGGGPHVRIFDASSGISPRLGFMAYAVSFNGGVYVAGGGLTTDPRDEVVTGAGEGGGPHVRIWAGESASMLSDFFAYAPPFSGGVRVAAGDGDGDGNGETVTGAGPGGGPHVRVVE